MRKKVLIVENRLERQKDYLGENLIFQLEELTKLGNVICADADAIQKYKTFKGTNDLPDDFVSEDYDLLAIHKSFADEDMDKLPQLVRLSKDIVFFSGGISQTMYNPNPSTGKANLFINSRDFYSERLILFLRKYTEEEIAPNLQYLVDGENWVLSMLLEARRVIEYRGFNELLEGSVKNRMLRDALNSNFKELDNIYEERAVDNMPIDNGLVLRDSGFEDKTNDRSSDKYLNEINRQIERILSKQ